MVTCFQGVAYKAGSLDEKTGELVALGASVVARCGPCARRHFDGAVRAGATADELREVFVLAMMVSAASTKNFANAALADSLSRLGIDLKPEGTPAANDAGCEH